MSTMDLSPFTLTCTCSCYTVRTDGHPTAPGFNQAKRSVQCTHNEECWRGEMCCEQFNLPCTYQVVTWRGYWHYDYTGEILEAPVVSPHLPAYRTPLPTLYSTRDVGPTACLGAKYLLGAATGRTSWHARHPVTGYSWKRSCDDHVTWYSCCAADSPFR